MTSLSIAMALEQRWAKLTEHSHSDVFVIEDLGQQRLPARTLVAVLRQAGFSVRLVHFGAESDPNEIVILAQTEQPRLIAFSIFFDRLVMETLTLATRLRAAGVAAHLTMTGPLPTFAHAELLAACPALDSVLRGEAEANVMPLATALCDASDWQAIPGLAYRSQVTPPLCPPRKRGGCKGEREKANLPTPALDLDKLPFPVRDDDLTLTHDGIGYAAMESGQGCYHACAFCLPCAFYRTEAGSPYRLRSIQNLMQEMEALYQRGVRLFLFDDEQFLPPGRARVERVKALADALEHRGMDIAFTIKCRADDVNEALFCQLKKMGLIRVYVGVESGCQASLDLLGKGITVERNAQALALLDKLDIVADFRSLLFHPWSTLETIQADIEFLEQVLPHVPTAFTFHEVECYPGTSLAERLQAERRCSGYPWQLAYTISDPRAELLRRLSRLVFDVERGVHSQITQAWYDILLQRRFWPQRFEANKARTLKGIVSRLNQESVAVWKEMLSFARGGDLYDASRVNERASAWAGRINAFDVTVGEELDLQLKIRREAP